MGLNAHNLRELLDYDAETGSFKWKVKPSKNRTAGGIAGSKHSSGRIYIGIEQKMYLAHRLAWLHVYGELPDAEVDHINGIKSDNRICNLRLASHAENMQNLRIARADSCSGLIGAMPHQGKWRSDIRLNGKKHYLGVFDTKEEASNAYIKAKRDLHSFCTI